MENINQLKRKNESTISLRSKRFKRGQSQSFVSFDKVKKIIFIPECDSRSPSKSSSEDVICDLGPLSFLEDHKKYVDVIYQVRCESKYLINHITPIVLCCQYQNPIRCTYRLLHKNVEHVIFLLNYDLNKEEPDEQILKVMKNLTDNVVTLVRILKTVKIIQEKLHRNNKALSKFELYVTHMKQIFNYVVHVLHNKKTINISSIIYNASPFSFHRLECRNCKEYVTFSGCRCTKWTYDTVPSQTIQNQLLSPAEDGPTPSNQNYINNWDYLKKRLNQISTWTTNLRHKTAVKQQTLNIDKKQTAVPTHCHSLIKLVPVKSVVELNSSSERTENSKQLLEEIRECPIDDSNSTNQIISDKL